MPNLVSPKSVYQCQKQKVSTPVFRKIRKTKVNIISAVQSCLLQICRLWHMRHAIAPTCLSTCLSTCLKQRHDKKSMPCLIEKASRCAADSTSKTAMLLSFTFHITERSFEKIMCIYLLFHWFSGQNCIIFTFSLRKG